MDDYKENKKKKFEDVANKQKSSSDSSITVPFSELTHLFHQIIKKWLKLIYHFNYGEEEEKEEEFDLNGRTAQRQLANRQPGSRQRKPLSPVLWSVQTGRVRTEKERCWCKRCQARRKEAGTF